MVFRFTFVVQARVLLATSCFCGHSILVAFGWSACCDLACNAEHGSLAPCGVLFFVAGWFLVAEFGALEETQCLGVRLFLCLYSSPHSPTASVPFGLPAVSSLRGCVVLGMASYACTFLFDDEGGRVLDNCAVKTQHS